MMKEKFKFLEHTADIKFRAYGDTLEKVFENSALALKEVICDKIKIHEKKEKKIKIKGIDLESLLYNFLEEFLFLLDSKGFIISNIKKIKIDKLKFILEAVILGDDSSDYNISNSVKAVTYNEMFIKKEKNKYVAQVVLDV